MLLVLIYISLLTSRLINKVNVLHAFRVSSVTVRKLTCSYGKSSLS